MSKNAVEKAQQRLTLPGNAVIIHALCDADAKEKKLARQIVGMQLGVTLVAASLAYTINGTQQIVLSVLGGGGVSMVNSGLLAWSMSRSARSSVLNAQSQLRLMYFYSAERFLVVVVLLVLCMAALKLSPLAVLSGFVIGQAMLLLTRWILAK